MATSSSRVRRILGMLPVLRLSAVVVTVFAVTACVQKVVEFENESLLISENASLNQVEQEIKLAARSAGWKVVRLRPGRLKATLLARRKFTVVVEIIHTTETMTIRYQDSKNLKYDGTNIHKSANVWIRDLKKSIVRHTSSLTAVDLAQHPAVANRGPTSARPQWPPERPATVPRGQASEPSTGTGFFVSTNGHILTNHHVVQGCRTTRASAAGTGAWSTGTITPAGMRVDPRGPRTASLGGGRLRVLGVDVRNDLALLKSEEISTDVAYFRSGRGVRTGDDIVVTGFPLQGLLTTDISVSKGIVSALAGPGNNRSMAHAFKATIWQAAIHATRPPQQCPTTPIRLLSMSARSASAL